MKTMNNSKFARSLMCLALAFVIFLGMHTTAHATISGTETWSGSDSSNVVRMYDTNLTYPKTMGQSGVLKLWFSFSPCDSSSSRIQIEFQARNITTGQIEYFTLYPDRNNDQYLTVRQGDVYQFYFDICTYYGDTKPGFKRTANVQYGYQFY